MQGINFKKARNFFLVIVCTMVFFSFVYFKGQSRSHRVFGVTYMTMNNPFYEVVNNELTKVIEANGDQLIALDPALDIDKQIQQIEYFMEMSVDGIFINPVDSSAILPVLQKAKDRGIIIIAVDASIIGDNVCDSTIVSDNYDAGVQCALDMMKRKEEANIVLLRHSAVSSADDRIKGFCDTIAPYSEYKIVADGDCEGQLELAMPLVQKFLQEIEEVDVVMALNDPSALGAMAALQSMDKTDVLVYGVDATPDMKTLIKTSDMAAGSAAQFTTKIGRIAGEHMYALLNNETVDELTIIPVELVTKDNISNFDEKGWQ